MDCTKAGRARIWTGYFLCNRSVPWYVVRLGIMGTQASAVTFLSAPGQAYTDGMRFVQYYFGLPLAMVVLCITFVPVFHRLKVYTAYEFLRKKVRSLKTRTLTSFLFLLQRGFVHGYQHFGTRFHHPVFFAGMGYPPGSQYLHGRFAHHLYGDGGSEGRGLYPAIANVHHLRRHGHCRVYRRPQTARLCTFCRCPAHRRQGGQTERDHHRHRCKGDSIGTTAITC